MDNNKPNKPTYFEKFKTFIKTNRTFHFGVIDLTLILILLSVYYLSPIKNDRSMSICLLGTYIVWKFLLNAIYMHYHPFKCGLQICV